MFRASAWRNRNRMSPYQKGRVVTASVRADRSIRHVVRRGDALKARGDRLQFAGLLLNQV
jgi:hypothetical protein